MKEGSAAIGRKRTITGSRQWRWKRRRGQTHLRGGKSVSVRTSREWHVKDMAKHAGAVLQWVRTLQARHRGCQHTVPHAAKVTGLHQPPETGGAWLWGTHLVPLPLGGQVGQTAAGHWSELLPPLAVAILIPPSVPEPGEEQARRHGADRTWRGDSIRPVRQLAAGTSSGRNQRTKRVKEMERRQLQKAAGVIRPVAYGLLAVFLTPPFAEGLAKATGKEFLAWGCHNVSYGNESR